MSYFKDNIDKMAGYVPGEQADTSKVIKLNTNENPYPPSPKVIDILKSIGTESLRTYPDPTGRALASAASGVIGVPPDFILPGNGSDNLIVMIARACGGPVVALGPTFPYYKTQAQVEDLDYIEVPFEKDFGFPVRGLIDAGGSVTFIANPNSPTGTAASLDQLAELATGLSGRGLLVIDEAYADFADENAVELIDRADNVIILRTLSKSYSLAGLRLGFAVAAPELLAGLDKAREIYNVGAVTQAAGIAALTDQAHKDANIAKICDSRRRLSDNLQAAGWKVIPSKANFILAGPPGGAAGQLSSRLKERGIFVRYFNRLDMEGYLRITVGTEDQNMALLDAAASILGEM